jgi:F-type H+-transporting ATPase subunit a
MAAKEDPFEKVLHEIQDTSTWVFFEDLFGGASIKLPSIPLPFGYEFQITKYMILELLVAGILCAIFIPLAKKIRTGALPKGPFWNFFETLLVFVRDEIARPNLDDPHKHHHDEHPKSEHAGPDDTEAGQAATPHHPPAEVHEADRFVPFLWTLFLFILLCNLLGLVPFLGSTTASIWVTGALALCAFLVMHGAGMVARGKERPGPAGVLLAPFAYLASLWPRLDLGPSLVARIGGLCLSLPLFLIELMGTVIKSGVLAIRLFANMFAGHVVLGMILLFIYTVGLAEGGPTALWTGVSISSVLGVLALSLLELFVAFLQAYVFTFLTALFIGMNLYPEH